MSSGKIVIIVLILLFSQIRGIKANAQQQRPNIVLIMTDDQGWGQTGYYNHLVLKTPNLDKMAENGLRFDRFYAGAPVCSPTRASVLTGRACVRSGVPGHGFALRKQEKVLPEALKSVGYATGHFGKWHLNGLRGPGVPVLKDDSHSPGGFGFDTWLTVTNYFDLNPIMSRNGDFVEFKGTSSDIIVEEALKFIGKAVDKQRPFFAVIWDGSPHAPFRAKKEDMQDFKNLNEKNRNHYGELVAFDRSVGTLRSGLRDLNIEKNTIVWYCSDNGGLPGIEPETVGGLRGYKSDIWEGGLRVPGIIEWEGHIEPRITDYPASTMDIAPTILDILDMTEDYLLQPVDGISLKTLIQNKNRTEREEPIPFLFQKYGALIDNEYKLVATNVNHGTFELYNLEKDKTESKDISEERPEKFEELKKEFNQWYKSVQKSIEGKDYPENRVKDENPERHFWMDDPRYEDFIKQHGSRPEYSGAVKRAKSQN
jgi:arylsulfatase A-like enzyme